VINLDLSRRKLQKVKGNREVLKSKCSPLRKFPTNRSSWIMLSAIEHGM